MSHSALAKQWDADRAVLGPWITTDSEWAIETLANASYDFVVIDCQHSLLDESVAARLLRGLANAPAAGMCGFPAMNPRGLAACLTGAPTA